ncbi:MAG: hypothetical protein ACKOQ6_08980 [Bacteroidota bacterium]
MIASLRMFYTSVGRKLVMAMTGLFLCVFLLEHLYGNLQLYKMDGGKAFNEYGEFLVNNLIIRTVEYLLFGSILLHIIDGMYLTLRNQKARPVRYAVNHASKNSTWFSRNMGLTGSIIFVFLSYTFAPISYLTVFLEWTHPWPWMLRRLSSHRLMHCCT